jgi:hypothetical protein
MKKLLFLFSLLFFFSLQAHMYHHDVKTRENSLIWEEENVPCFDELMLSFNGTRPEEGDFEFYISVKDQTWSEELLYTTWGQSGQKSYDKRSTAYPCHVYQDGFNVLEGKKAKGFKIRVSSKQGTLQSLSSLHVYTNSDFTLKEKPCTLPGMSTLNISGLSQMMLNHTRNQHLCSPTSTTAAIRYLTRDERLDPVFFADHILDEGFNIYGNWVFAVAEASTYLGSSWYAYVDRLNGFEKIVHQIQNEIPVVVSITGPLIGGALPYLKGHLMVVIGYDEAHQQVMCMDPAFQTKEQALTTYPLKDFMQAWNRKGRVAYIFSRINR